MRTPWRGFSEAYFRRMAIRPGISCSETWMVLRPHSARLRSLTLKSGWPLPEPAFCEPFRAGLAKRERASLMADIFWVRVKLFVWHYFNALFREAALSVFSHVLLSRSSTLPKWP